ncbi:MAG: hypothetical protein HC862_17530 [Scytonema sp. RU_4_4]|nr:hypothetical protein [Scytonema sp. RU_4_4]
MPEVAAFLVLNTAILGNVRLRKRLTATFLAGSTRTFIPTSILLVPIGVFRLCYLAQFIGCCTIFFELGDRPRWNIIGKSWLRNIY